MSWLLAVALGAASAAELAEAAAVEASATQRVVDAYIASHGMADLGEGVVVKFGFRGASSGGVGRSVDADQAAQHSARALCPDGAQALWAVRNS